MASVIVDQADSSQITITAGGPGLPHGSAVEYKQTVTAYNAGGSWTFSWTGTDIAIYGSVLFTGRGNASYSVDSGVPRPYTAPIEDLTRRAHYKYFETSGLADGKHSVTATQSLTDTRGTMYYDYLIYKVGAATAVTKDMLYFVDDSEMNLVGTGFSQTQGRFDAFKETLTNADKSSTFSYKFYGTGISIYGFLLAGSGPYGASFTIDGGPTFEFQASASDVKATERFTQFNHEFFTIESLDQSKEHTVTFTANTDGLAIDYALVMPGEGGSRTVTAALGGSSNAPSSSPAPSSISEAKKSSPVGAIAGGVVGGIAVLAALIFFFLWKRKCSNSGPKARRTSFDAPGQPDPSWTASPYVHRSPATTAESYPQTCNPTDLYPQRPATGPYPQTIGGHDHTTSGLFTAPPTSSRLESQVGLTTMAYSPRPSAPATTSERSVHTQSNSQTSRPWNGPYPPEKTGQRLTVHNDDPNVNVGGSSSAAAGGSGSGSGLVPTSPTPGNVAGGPDEPAPPAYA